MKCEIAFGDEKVKNVFNKLNENNEAALCNQLTKAFQNLKEDAFCGIQIPKNLIPKEYIKRFGQLTNLWKYNLPDAWRLIYTIQNDKINVLSVILEWMDHKEYERRFNY
jgi:Txe/YoeB family toxin of Txe-Axe toxin-antitoxin module